MIESRFWKEDLLAHAKRLKPVKTPKRWSERAIVNLEKDLMVSFFLIRSLIERHKLTDRAVKTKVIVSSYPWNGKPVTLMNYHNVDALYDLERSKTQAVSLGFLANQFVHARALYVMRDESRNWSAVLLCSDYEKEKAIHQVSVEDIRNLFTLVGRDWVRESSMKYDEALKDYRVQNS
jgi:hypothetical protein